MAFTKINAAGIGTTETVTLDGLTVINDGSFGGNLTVSGVLTYEDVTNVDSVGLITARNGIVVGSGITLSKDGDIFATGITTVSENLKVGTGVTISPDGDGFFTGVITATSYSGIDLSAVTGATGDFSIADKIVHTGDTNTAIRFPTTDTISFETSGSEGARLDAGRRFLIGSTTARTSGGSAYAHLQVEGTDSPGAEILVIRNSNDTYASTLGLVKTRGTSDGAVTTVQDNDKLGQIQFRGADGSDIYAVAASIHGEVDGSPSDGTDMPGALVFGTTADGAASPTERLRITSDGNLNINSSGLSSPYSSFRHISINNNLILNAANSAGGFAGMQHNAYLNSSGNWVRVNNDHATSIGTDDGNFYFRNAGAGTGTISWNQRLTIKSSGDIGFNDSSPTAHASGNNTVLSIKGKGSSYSGKIDFKDSDGNLDSYINSDNATLQIYVDPGTQNGSTSILFNVHAGERLRIGAAGQLGLSGANYGTAGQVLKSNGSSSAVSWGAAGKVLQVVHAEKPDHYFSTDTSFNDVASLSVTITPTSSSTKMLITVNVFANCEDAAILRLVRYRADLGTAAIGNGQAGTDANVRGFAMVRQDDGNLGSGYGMQTLHTPGSTVEHTYKVQARCTSSSAALAINRRADDATYGLVSSISVMEIG